MGTGRARAGSWAGGEKKAPRPGGRGARISAGGLLRLLASVGEGAGLLAGLGDLARARLGRVLDVGLLAGLGAARVALVPHEGQDRDLRAAPLGAAAVLGMALGGAVH